jgi:hypothetical protein
VGVGSSDLFGREGVLCSPLISGYSAIATLTHATLDASLLHFVLFLVPTTIGSVRRANRCPQL